ncbi:MAG: hypothetical protein COT84_02875 [Chlamydiae bacterium CG10_big_fil_rev_8_21_14_0_10_35_9]|nr:MAG: hypothetical protein COT84_02875 [Chlamydiae bacterium CG10_big_fil_rev_8_21_14_0_10_35_9]
MTAISNSRAPIFVSVEKLLRNRLHIGLGVANVDLTARETHARTRVFFSEDYTEAELVYTRKHIQHGLPKHIQANQLNPGCSADWIRHSRVKISMFLLEAHGIDEETFVQSIPEFINKCIASVKHLTIRFDSEKTYQGPLGKALITCCKERFPNLRSYSLVCGSL